MFFFQVCLIQSDLAVLICFFSGVFDTKWPCSINMFFSGCVWYKVTLQY